MAQLLNLYGIVVSVVDVRFMVRLRYGDCIIYDVSFPSQSCAHLPFIVVRNWH